MIRPAWAARAHFANAFHDMQHSMISMALTAVSLRDLALVDAVHRHGSFNRAARAMHISPSGLSHQVQKVEQALGTPLFERGGRRIVPTAGGRRLLREIDQVLAAAEQLQLVARAGEVAFGGELRLGLPASLGPYLLPHLVAPFPQHFPGARLGISEGKPRGLLRRLGEGELDAVLAPVIAPASGIRADTLFFEPWELLLRADHPLAGRAGIALDRLDPAEATLMAESHADGLDGEGQEHGQVQDVSLESLAALVSLRGGYTLVPALAHERLASMPGIVLARPAGAARGREIALYWRDASPWQDDLARFAGLLRQLARSLPGLKVRR